MKRSRFTDSQILSILKQNESGIAATELCQEHGISTIQHSISGAPGMVVWICR